MHLLLGIAGLALARKASIAVAYLIDGGVVHLVLFVHGIVVGHLSPGNLVPTNRADDWQGGNANRAAM